MAGDLAAAAEALVGLAGLLGITHEQLSRAEEPDRLAHEFPVGGQSAAQLTPAAVAGFLSAFGSAGRVEIRTDALQELLIADGTTADQVAAFTGTAASGGPYVAAFTIDKRPLATAIAGPAPQRAVRVFLLAGALRDRLQRGIASFEKDVWPEAPAPLVLAVADTDVHLTGPNLAVLGGEFLPKVTEAAATPPIATDFAALASRREAHIGWDSPWVRSLTPWHFELAGLCADNPLRELLQAQLAKLVILYTCDRARARAHGPGPAEISAEYRGREHVAVMAIDERNGLAAGGDEMIAILAAASWCYREHGSAGPDWISDRLPFMQARLAQHLEPQPPSDRLSAFVHSMPHLLEGVRWQWKSFIEGKIDVYLGQVQHVEATVGETVASFADRAQTLATRTIESALAAVGVVVGSFIAAAFKDPFNATLFRLGLRSYALYVVAFPCAVGLTAAYTNVRMARRTYDSRIHAARDILHTDKVDKIAGERVNKAQRAVYCWMLATGLIYLLVAAGAWVAADEIPRRVQRDPAEQPATPMQPNRPSSANPSPAPSAWSTSAATR